MAYRLLAARLPGAIDVSYTTPIFSPALPFPPVVFPRFWHVEVAIEAFESSLMIGFSLLRLLLDVDG